MTYPPIVQRGRVFLFLRGWSVGGLFWKLFFYGNTGFVAIFIFDEIHLSIAQSHKKEL